jgi:hypothetical protein
LIIVSFDIAHDAVLLKNPNGTVFLERPKPGQKETFHTMEKFVRELILMCEKVFFCFSMERLGLSDTQESGM